MAPGILGITVGTGVFICLFIGIGAALEGARYQFSQDFEKLLAIYLDVTKFILSMAAGGIVLVVSATIFRLSGTTTPLPPRLASPLAILVLTILYGVLFMVLLARSYEI